MWGRKEGGKEEGETNYTFSNFFLSRIAAYERVFVHVVSMHFKKVSFCMLETIVCFFCLIPAQVTSRKWKVKTKKFLFPTFLFHSIISLRCEHM